MAVWGFGTPVSVCAQTVDAQNGADSQASDAGISVYSQPDETSLTFSSDAGGEPADGAEVPEATVPGALGITDLLWMVLVLAGVVLAIYGLFWIIKRGKRIGRPSDSLLTIQDQLVLGGSRILYLIGLGEKTFLVGGSDSSVNLIAEIQDQETLTEIRLRAARNAGVGKKTFSSMLSGLLHRQEPAQSAAAAAANPESDEAVMPSGEKQVAFDFLAAQRERLKKW